MTMFSGNALEMAGGEPYPDMFWAEVGRITRNPKIYILENLSIIEMDASKFKPGIYYIRFKVKDYIKIIPIVKE